MSHKGQQCSAAAGVMAAESEDPGHRTDSGRRMWDLGPVH